MLEPGTKADGLEVLRTAADVLRDEAGELRAIADELVLRANQIDLFAFANTEDEPE